MKSLDPTVPVVSFFRDDLIDRIAKRILGRYARSGLALMLLVLSVTWLPVLVLDELAGPGAGSTFLGNYAAFVYLLVTGLLLKFRAVFDYELRQVQDVTHTSGVLDDASSGVFADYLQELNERLRGPVLTAVIIAAAFTVSLVSLFGTRDAGASWMVRLTAAGSPEITAAGWYHYLVGVPLYVSVVFYWVSKHVGWALFIRKFASLGPRLKGQHPDGSGGVAYFADASLAVSIFVFLMGVVQVATVVYKVDVEGLSPMSLPVFMIVGLYLALAPVLFALPISFLTVPLYRARKSGIKLMSGLGFWASQGMEDFAREHEGQSRIPPAEVGRFHQLSATMAVLDRTIENTQKMRIWPADLRSMTRFVFSTLAPLVPLAIKFFDLGDRISRLLSF